MAIRATARFDRLPSPQRIPTLPLGTVRQPPVFAVTSMAQRAATAADIEEKGGAVENIFYMSDAPQGRFVGWVVDYTGGDGAAYTVTVLGGGEKVYSKGGEPVPQIKSFTNYLMTAASSEVPAGNWSKGKPGQKVFEFEWTSRAEPIKWIEERPMPPPGGPKLK